ncbi:MAG: hypothetical protein Q7V88_07030 [Actinomycetota bacterium]|nr:hypothetical protein [Actinomycetota bacterium]
MARNDHDGEPTLAQAWAMLGSRLGLAEEVRGERSIRAHGVVRGRPVAVEIEGDTGGTGFARFLFGLNTISSRNRREKWHTTLTVGCVNPSGATGIIESAVDVRDPAWTPGAYDPRNGRSVRSDPPTLAARVLTADTHERLMSIMADVRIDVQPTSIRIDHHGTALPGPGANYVAGSLIHHFQGPPPPWPERALAGPPWWIDLLCELADTLDR